ncbi:MAG: hypothetical protein EOM52_06515 [Clostridia bacterium]|nr:hypothetical protein [Clostridia bacterium]
MSLTWTRSKKYFEKADYGNGETFNVATGAYETYIAAAQAWGSDLAKIGININIVSFDNATYVNDIKVSRNCPPLLWRFAFYAEYFSVYGMAVFNQVGNIAAVVLFALGIRGTGASTGAVINMLEPAVSMVASTLLSHDPLTAPMVLGYVLVLSSVFLVATEGKRNRAD